MALGILILLHILPAMHNPAGQFVQHGEYVLLGTVRVRDPSRAGIDLVAAGSHPDRDRRRRWRQLRRAAAALNVQKDDVARARRQARSVARAFRHARVSRTT